MYQVVTKEDHSYSGLILKRSPEALLLKDADLNEIVIQTGQIVSIQPQQLSAMPEGIVQNMHPQDAADLIEFLSSLR